MPKIKNWSREDQAGPARSICAWRHDETGEILYVSHKVPNDGYYVMSVPPEVAKDREFVTSGKDAERKGYSHIQNVARQIATSEIRDHPAGFYDSN